MIFLTCRGGMLCGWQGWLEDIGRNSRGIQSGGEHLENAAVYPFVLGWSDTFNYFVCDMLACRILCGDFFVVSSSRTYRM